MDKALEILGRSLRQPGAAFADPEAVKNYMRLHIGGERVEKFCALYLDSQNRAVAFETLFIGTITQTSVYPRELVHSSIEHCATSVILAHNHPSGNVLPSRADEALTQTLRAALALIDVRVLDHIIVGGGAALSMAQCGFPPFGQVADPAIAEVAPIEVMRKRGRPRKSEVVLVAA